MARAKFMEEIENEDDDQKYKRLNEMIDNPTLSNQTPSREGHRSTQALDAVGSAADL